MFVPRLLAPIQKRIADLNSDHRGSVALTAALAFPVLIGGMGIGAEVGYWYLTQRKLQHAADVSAYAAAVRLSAGDSQTELEEAAEFIATESGFRTSIGTIAVHNPPTSGPNAGDTTMVEVVLTEATPRYFSGFFTDGSVQISGRAVAKDNGQKVCVLALSSTASNALQIGGSSDPTFTNCAVASNSTASTSIKLNGNAASLNADCVY